MNRKYNAYEIIPSVVPSNKISKVVITPKGNTAPFKNGVRYVIDLIPSSVSDVPFPDTLKIPELARSFERAEAVAEGGSLMFEFLFKHEQKWTLHIFDTEPTDGDAELFDPKTDGWEALINNSEIGVYVEMYSLDEELITRRPYKGDLHIHSTRSDGAEAPETVAANCRSCGMDFISITDHHKFGSSECATEKLSGLETRFVLYSGEEIHNDDFGQIHIINFDAHSSVNERILGDERAEILEAIEHIKESYALKGYTDANQIAWRIWTYEAIKESGGVCIFPHPYWTNFGVDHASFEMIEYTFKNGLLDAFEVYGGTTHRDNNLQALLYHEMRANGYDYPIVASTDAHSSAEYGNSYTVAFAKDVNGVREAILGGYTACVLDDEEGSASITAVLRHAKYLSFLLDNYFPHHDELCAMSGKLMLSFLNGDDKSKEACEAVELQIREYENRFFAQ